MLVKRSISTYVTRHEKTGLMYTKYTYSYYVHYVSPLLFMILEICKLHQIPYEKLHKQLDSYDYLLYFAWADQRVQQFYNYHNVSRR